MLDNFSTLKEICYEKLKERDLIDDNKYVERLELELKELQKIKGEEDYFLDLYNKKLKFAKNENNLLIAYLLDICDDICVDISPEFTGFDPPDIDTDYIDEIRAHLKDEFAPQQYGEEYVCNIATYGTFGLKSLLIDLTRIFGGNRTEIVAITKKIGLKDEDSDTMTLDKALKLYPALKEWAEHNPEIIDATRKMLHADIDWEKYGYKGEPPHRIRQSGTHAGGLVISSKPISDYVPLIRGKDGVRCAAWPEGLASQELSAMGFVKFDYLGIDALDKIAACTKLIYERHNVKSLFALPEQPNWSDTSFLEDQLCLETANRGDLKMIFQFDSEGIRQLAIEGGVTSFHDLVAYSALYRPSTIELGMHKIYCNRKKGLEEYELHPVLEPILGKTYAVMIFQEQIMRILQKVGKIDINHAMAVIKAISKKNKGKFEKYKEQFIKNAQEVLGISQEEAEKMWEQVEAFSGYGFNAAHAVEYTFLTFIMLYLKCHYPIEFYAGVMSYLKTGDDRINIYRQDADKHNICIERVDINKSGMDFTSITDEKIYYALSKVKGIGEDAAEEIIAKRPYDNFEDFLKKFGTNGVIMKPIIGLRMFKDKDPVSLYKFYAAYKENEKKIKDKQKRYQNNLLKFKNKLFELTGEDDLQRMDELAERYLDNPEKLQSICTLISKHDQCVGNYNKSKKKNDIHLDTFDFDNCDVELDKDLVKIFKNQELSEMTYYGFVWTHPLKDCVNYDGFTFEQHRLDTINGYGTAPVDVLVKNVNIKMSQKNKMYCQLDVEDAHYEEQKVNIWKEDYERFKEHLTVGNMLKLRLNSPSGGFSTYTFESLPRWKKISKDVDYRLLVLRKKEKNE